MKFRQLENHNSLKENLLCGWRGYVCRVKHNSQLHPHGQHLYWDRRCLSICSCTSTTAVAAHQCDPGMQVQRRRWRPGAGIIQRDRLEFSRNASLSSGCGSAQSSWRQRGQMRLSARKGSSQWKVAKSLLLVPLWVDLQAPLGCPKFVAERQIFASGYWCPSRYWISCKAVFVILAKCTIVPKLALVALNPLTLQLHSREQAAPEACPWRSEIKLDICSSFQMTQFNGWGCNFSFSM